MLPPRKKRERSGIERAPKREWHRHRAWLRRHQCVVPGCINMVIEVSHIRTAANAGTGLKPHDSSAVPMCGEHHRELHSAGVNTFQAIHRVDLTAMAAEFARRSPDKAMKETMCGTA